MKKLLRWLLLIMPACLFLSYHPVISLGGNETMNFELSVAELWLVVFDVVGLVVLIQEKRLFRDCKKWWKWVLLPVWVTASVVWSLNVTRGLLTVGLMWLIVMAVYVMWTLRDMLDGEFRRRWWKWFFGSTLVVCGWCVVQCVMDLAGVPRECTLMCEGCTYRMFGFPHPNGFAIEPQFMGNLLLAPVLASTWLFLKGDCNSTFRTRVARARCHGASALILGRNLRNVLKVLLPIAPKKTTTGLRSLYSKILLACFFAIAFTIFLTFSRGAIYAGVVGMMVVSGVEVVRCKKKRGVMWKRVGVVWLAVVGAFVVALVAQGVMAEVSPTKDTFGDGVAKVVEHLSLGVIKTRGGGTDVEDGGGVVEKSVENSSGEAKNEEAEAPGTETVAREVGDDKQEAVFDGYVAESTDTRVRLTGAAVKIWAGDVKTALVGVGIGGAGQALYNNALSPAPKEIVQNEYASLLLETGVVGVVLAVVMVVLLIRVVWRSEARGMLMGLVVAYGVSLLFFSGLPNALQVYLMPVMLMVAGGGKTGMSRNLIR